MKAIAREWQLVLPLGLFFAVFVFAPLALLGAVSFYNDSAITTPGVAQYVKFLTDRFNMAVRKFLKHVGVTSQREIENVVREGKVEGDVLKVRMTMIDGEPVYQAGGPSTARP